MALYLFIISVFFFPPKKAVCLTEIWCIRDQSKNLESEVPTQKCSLVDGGAIHLKKNMVVKLDDFWPVFRVRIKTFETNT